MADTAENEPTMEEILSSIRRIINEDDEAPAEDGDAEPEAAAEEAAADDFDAVDAFDEIEAEPEAEDAGDVLELTEKVDEPDMGTDPLAMDNDLMIVDREEEEEPEPVFDAAPVEEEVEDAIMGEPAAAMAAGAFGSLLDNIRISETEGQTLEGVVRALLRPMLKDWLDANLPDIVEEKVQAEIERVARRRR
jgi:cell pole-organizing protein PopZ